MDQTMGVGQGDAGRVRRPSSLVCALPGADGAGLTFWFLIFQSLSGPPRRVPPRATCTRGPRREGPFIDVARDVAAPYMSIASAISTEPPAASSGQAFALAAASS